MDADKKKRSQNWDSSEISLLRQLVEKNLVVIRSKHCNTLTNKMKNDVWKRIASEINALGLHCRSVAEVKVKWQNMQSNAKKTYAEVKKHAQQTGGGPPATPVDQESQNIIDMMKDTTSFVGLTGEESGVNEVECDSAEELNIPGVKSMTGNLDEEIDDEVEIRLLQPAVKPVVCNITLDKENDPVLPVMTPNLKRQLKKFCCPTKEKKIKQEDLISKQHEVLCKQADYYDLKNQKLKMEIAIMRTQMEKQELTSSMCDLFGLQI